jgi:hypothetical protein
MPPDSMIPKQHIHDSMGMYLYIWPDIAVENCVIYITHSNIFIHSIASSLVIFQTSAEHHVMTTTIIARLSSQSRIFSCRLLNI